MVYAMLIYSNIYIFCVINVIRSIVIVDVCYAY